MDKQFALNQLRHKRNAFIYMCASSQLLNSDAIEHLIGVSIIINDEGIIYNYNDNDRTNESIEIDLTQIVAVKRHDNSNFNVDLKEFYKFVRRNLIKESYEVVHEYASSNNKITALKAEPWYWYARVIRNTVSHSLRYEFKANDIRNALPIQWEGKTIDISLDGTVMKEDVADALTTLRLVHEMHDFVIKY